MRDNEPTILFPKPSKLTDSSLDRICVSLAKTINCRAKEIHAIYDKNIQNM